MQVLRVAFYLLLFGNLLLFAYAQGYLGKAGGGGEAERLAGQIQPENIRIVGRGAPPKAGEAPAAACRSLAGLPREQAQRLVEWLRGRDAQLKASVRAPDELQSWWVFIPPLSSKKEAEKKAVELKKLSLPEYQIVQEKGPNQYAISLGLFSSERSAREYLETLGKKGVRAARIKAREAAASKGDGMATVEVRGAPENLARALAGLPAEFASAAASDCAAGK